MRKEIEEIIWTTGEMDGYVDCFRSPMPSKDYRVKNKKVEGWPSFHASPADPDGGYQSHRYRIFFTLDKQEALVLHIKLLVSTPRLPELSIAINGETGRYYPRPMPSDEKQIKPSHALHAAIYSKDEIRIAIPEEFVRQGENVLSIEAEDQIPKQRIENDQAVLRLDRMADACGFHYGACYMTRQETIPGESFAEVYPGVLYTRENSMLMEHCTLLVQNVEHLPLKENRREGSGLLKLCWKENRMEIPVSYRGGAFGQAKVEFLLPDGEGEVTFCLEGDVKASGRFVRKRKWKVYTMPHAHTDIGYTHRQWEVAERMCRNLDTAVKLLEKEEQFSYIIDGTWHLEAYENTRNGKKRDALKRLIQEKRVGIPWNYADVLTQFPNLEALIHNGDYSTSYLEELGMTPKRADVVDVASISGSYPAVLAGSGVKYLIHADNQDRGPFRFNGGLHKKSPFLWEGPDGSRIMVWLAKMYCELKKVCGSPLSMEAAKKGLAMWLEEYEREDYPGDAVMLYGMEADNTDLDVRAPSFYQDWKERVEYPQLIPSDGTAFFEYMEQFREKLYSYKGDEGAYWEDGMASSAAESFLVRRTQSGLIAAGILDSLAVLSGPGCRYHKEEYQEAWKQILLYGEHTWGAFLSGSDPDAQLQKDQWEVKKQMAWQAYTLKQKLLTQAVSKLSLMWNNKGREIVAFNPYSFSLADYLEVEIGLEEYPAFTGGRPLDYEVVQETATQKVIRMYTGELAPFSCRRWELKALSGDGEGSCLWEIPDTMELSLENDWYRLAIDCTGGFLRSWYDKELCRELVENEKGKAGRLLYADGGEETTLLGNRDELKRGGVMPKPFFTGTRVKKRKTACGDCVEIEGDTLHGPCSISIILPRHKKEVTLTYKYEKEPVYELEALYAEFPFQIRESAQILSDSQIGWVDWRKDCLPGACREWLPLQTSILLKDENCQIQIASPDAFLFTAGTIVKGSWQSDMNLDASHIYSYILNNYWRVNYRGAQAGTLHFSYVLTSGAAISYEQAYRFGQRVSSGIIGARMSYQEFRKDIPAVWEQKEASLLSWDSDHIVLYSMQGGEEENSLLLRLLETGGKAGSVRFTLFGISISAMWKTDLQGRILEEMEVSRDKGGEAKLQPFEVQTIKLVWR